MRIFSSKLLFSSNKETDWIPPFRALSNSDWRGAAFGNGLFVAISNADSRYAVSNNGLNWEEGENTILRSEPYNAITFDGEKFCIISTSGYTSTSLDGINWTQPNPALSSYGWRALSYGNGTYTMGAIVSTNGINAYSSDFVNWTIKAFTEFNWRATTFDGAKFVSIIRTSNNYIYFSTDGHSWTPETQLSIGSSGTWMAISYGNNKYISLSDNGYISTSDNGSSWTTAAQNEYLSDISTWSGMTFGKNKFIAISSNGYVSIKRV